MEATTMPTPCACGERAVSEGRMGKSCDTTRNTYVRDVRLLRLALPVPNPIAA